MQIPLSWELRCYAHVSVLFTLHWLLLFFKPEYLLHTLLTEIQYIELQPFYHDICRIASAQLYGRSWQSDSCRVLRVWKRSSTQHPDLILQTLFADQMINQLQINVWAAPFRPPGLLFFFLIKRKDIWFIWRDALKTLNTVMCHGFRKRRGPILLIESKPVTGRAQNYSNKCATD